MSDEEVCREMSQFTPLQRGLGSPALPRERTRPEELYSPQPSGLCRAVQGLGIRQAKQLFSTPCSVAAKWNRFHGRLRREGGRGYHLLHEGRSHGWESGVQPAEWGWGGICRPGLRSPQAGRAPTSRGCQAGSGPAGVEGGGRLRRGASLPAGIGRLEPAALALAG